MCVPVCTCTCSHTHRHMCLHEHTDACIHVHIHTCTHTHTLQVCPSVCRVGDSGQTETCAHPLSSCLALHPVSHRAPTLGRPACLSKFQPRCPLATLQDGLSGRAGVLLSAGHTGDRLARLWTWTWARKQGPWVLEWGQGLRAERQWGVAPWPHRLLSLGGTWGEARKEVGFKYRAPGRGPGCPGSRRH